MSDGTIVQVVLAACVAALYFVQDRRLQRLLKRAREAQADAARTLARAEEHLREAHMIAAAASAQLAEARELAGVDSPARIVVQ